MNAPFLFAWKKLLIYQQEIAGNKKPPEGGLVNYLSSNHTEITLRFLRSIRLQQVFQLSDL